MDFAGPLNEGPPFLHTYSRYGPIHRMRTAQGTNIAAATASWGATDLIRYYPMTLPFPYLVRRAWWVNGSAAVGDRDFGIYTHDGTLLYSTGTTAATPASTPQFTTLGTPLLLSPGEYYFAFISDRTTNGMWGSSAAATAGGIQRLSGILHEQAASTVLPAVATFEAAATTGINFCGVTWTPSGFV